MTAAAPADGIEALFGIVTVSRETAAKLENFVALLHKWQAAENLVAPSTLPAVWKRHVADSAQLVALFPDARTWLDLGSGAGFPGLVVAILLGDCEGVRVDLVESNRRKCAFLRRAIAETGAPAVVHDGRIEAVVSGWAEPVDVVTARALAPLKDLMAMVHPVLARGGRAALHKGRDFAREIDEASKSWEFDLVKHASRIDDKGLILEIRGLAPRSPGKAAG